MTIQRRFAPISGRFEPERVAGFAGISRKNGMIIIHTICNERHD